MIDSSHDERRDFYRIQDTVGLSYIHCVDDDVPTEESFVTEIPDEFQLITHLSNLDMDSSTLLHSIKDVSPDISRYLKIINSKIEALARHVVTLGLDDNIKSQPVILSAGGISIITTESISIDAKLRLNMVLYPSCSGILTYGKVVRCEKNADSETPAYEVALEYILINESDRDALVRHVLQLQSNYLRKTK